MARIVIVEDDDIVSEMLAGRLAAAGHSVTVVEDGADALARICALVPDLVMLDCALPTMSGANVMRELRKRLPEADIPVILMSARAADDYIQAMLLEGAATYFVKPLNMRKVLDTVAHQLMLKGARQAHIAA